MHKCEVNSEGNGKPLMYS